MAMSVVSVVVIFFLTRCGHVTELRTAARHGLTGLAADR